MRTNMITDEQIEQLEIEAGRAGDTEMVLICQRALNGSAHARKQCARAMQDAQARAAEQG